MDKRFQTVLVLIALGFLAAGCRQEPIRAYDVPREGNLPPGWTEAPAGEMRVATYKIKGPNGKTADLGIVRLPSMGDRNLDNVNRWRSAVGQKALSETEFAQTAETISVGGSPGKLYEVSGPSAETDDPIRILGAIVDKDGMGWYFKMSGDDKFVASQKPVLLDFLKKFSFPEEHTHHHGGEEMASGTGADPHAGLNLAGGGQPAAAADPQAAPERSWPAPASWQQQAPGMMQLARFSVGGGKAVVSVAEASGGMDINVQRWRTQLGMSSASEADTLKSVAPLDLGGVKANLVDLAGEKQRMVVVVVPNGNTSIFFKLMGEPAAVAAEKDALIDFAKKAK